MKNKTAFLWDESYLWGLMACDALRKNRLPFDLISSEDIKKGTLVNYKMLFVPGGWASNKLKALEDKGIEQIKTFIYNGGSYLGLCGGAGLATLDGIGLLNIKRRPTKDRVPSFSGRVKLDINEHPMWEGFKRKTDNDYFNQYIFYAWWPSQFIVDDKNIQILASYGEPMPDAFTSDFCIGDISFSNGNWSELEALYAINLNPLRLFGEPAVIEGKYGEGKVILSLVHFDTPDDIGGQIVLNNLWKYLLGDNFAYNEIDNPSKTYHFPDKKIAQYHSLINELLNIISDLINIGIRNFLWFQRNSLLFQWRRGIRGLEYCNLYVLIKRIYELLGNYSGNTNKTEHPNEGDIYRELLQIRELLLPFCKKASELLVLERIALQKGHITYEKCDDHKINSLRNELFSNSKSYGGAYKNIISKIDNLLYNLMKSTY